MTWDQYVAAFEALAAERGRDDAYVTACLGYAEPLWSNGLPVIYDIAHFAQLVGYDPDYVLQCSYASAGAYREFPVKKKAGGVRLINEPLPSLKEIQRWILDQILHRVPISRFAKAFALGRDIKENARFHRGQRVVLSLDVLRFFPSLTRIRVHRLFRSLGYSPSVTGLLAHLCTLDGVLPQGAPTSPAISNLLLRNADRRLGGLALSMGVRYTRYADDLTFSGNFQPGPLIRFTKEVLRPLGLRLNEAKTRVMRPHQRQEVTGIVVNRRLRAPREMRRELRASVYYIRRFGLGEHLAQIGERRTNYVLHLLGKANFILHVDPDDVEARAALEFLYELHRDHLDRSQAELDD